MLGAVAYLRRLGRSSEANTVCVYHNPSEAFEELWGAIEGAKREILMLTYIVKNDDVGQRTLSLLRDAARRGVRVVFVYDDAGNITGRQSLVSGLASEPLGEVHLFRPFVHSWLRYIASGFDWAESPVLRNHRKILVIDDKVAYVGGVNVGNEYAGRPCEGPYLISGRTFRDSLAKLTGPCVRDIKEVLWDTLHPVKPEGRSAMQPFAKWVDALPSAFPSSAPPPPQSPPLTGEYEPPVCSTAEVQMLSCDPWARDYSIQKALAVTARHVESRLWLTTPYYCPPPHTADAIEAAARSGKDVRILVGGKGTTDPPIMWYVQQMWYKRALESGVRIFEFSRPKEIMHAKAWVADGVYGSVGSFNLDLLSDRILEANVGITGRTAAEQLERQFLRDTTAATEVTLADLDHRGWTAPRVAYAIYATSRALLGGTFNPLTDM